VPCRIMVNLVLIILLVIISSGSFIPIHPFECVFLCFDVLYNDIALSWVDIQLVVGQCDVILEQTRSIHADIAREVGVSMLILTYIL